MFKPTIIIILVAMALLFAAPVIDPALLSFDPPHHFFNAAAIAMPAIAETSGSWSIRGWCAYRGISVSAFYKMRKLGTAPTVAHPKGAPPRITVEADASWLKRVNDLADEAASEQRRQKAIVAGRAAAASPRHVSNKDRAQ